MIGDAFAGGATAMFRHAFTGGAAAAGGVHLARPVGALRHPDAGDAIPAWPRTSPYDGGQPYIRVRAERLFDHCCEADRNPLHVPNADLAVILGYRDARSMEEAFRQKGVQAMDVKEEAYYRWRRSRENS
jgi:hypothetical protein